MSERAAKLRGQYLSSEMNKILARRPSERLSADQIEQAAVALARLGPLLTGEDYREAVRVVADVIKSL